MSALVSDAALAECLSAARPGAKVARPGPEPLASPSYLALESRSVLVENDGATLFLKVMHPEMASGFDMTAAVALARAAGEAGIGPEVIWADPARGAILMQALTKGWDTAKLHHLQDRGVQEAVATALRRLHATPALGARFDAFAEIDRLAAETSASGVALPADFGWIQTLLGAARAPLLAGPLAPCRNDGSCSNLMVSGKGGVMLLDFDRAGMNDPLYDLGTLMAETTDFEADMAPMFLAYLGGWDAVDFARARLWAIVDDMMHALWARVHGARSERRSVEWLKYGEWRLMRARLALHHPQFEEKLRMIGGVA
jgi:thiamine kinase-like enzyme